MSRAGLSDVAIGGGRLKPTSGDGEAAMAMVYVVTAGSGDSYRIERVYLDGEQAYSSPRTTTASRRWNRSGGGMAGR